MKIYLVNALIFLFIYPIVVNACEETQVAISERINNAQSIYIGIISDYQWIERSKRVYKIEVNETLRGQSKSVIDADINKCSAGGYREVGEEVVAFLDNNSNWYFLNGMAAIADVKKELNQ